uniref:DUF4283 domain-containing protein n=1 Tax=Quercus lobata TaxID=97700 RepID=A0A7N2LPC3_QUELO
MLYSFLTWFKQSLKVYNISISTTSKSELLEECALSLFGRLLADRNQNLRALKSTLKSAWKLGSDLRIVDVGKNIFQFKFNSKYQMEWVERNGPWNFDNNLLLMCRWKKGLSITNISFTHSPFWVQVWGLLFENMSEEVGRDLGNKLGKSSTFEAHRQYEDWLRANGGSKMGSEKLKKSNSSGFEDHREGGSIDWQTLLASVSMDTEVEPTGFPMSIQNAALPKNAQPGHEGVLDMPSVKASASNPAKGG